MSSLGRILLVEDDPKDVELTLTRLWSRVTARKPWIIFTTGETS